MAFNKIDGVSNISKHINRWRKVVTCIYQQSRYSQAAPKPSNLEQENTSDPAVKVAEHPSSWSKMSPVSLLFQTAPRPAHDRTIELKKAAAQLSQSNETLKAHYIQKRNDRLFEKNIITKPQTSQKLNSLMSFNIAMAETKEESRSRSFSAPPRSVDIDHAMGVIDFKPQKNRQTHWQFGKPQKETKGSSQTEPTEGKDRQKCPQDEQTPQHSFVQSTSKLRTGAVSEDGRHWQKSPSKLAEEAAVKTNPMTKWHIGSMSIPRLDI